MIQEHDSTVNYRELLLPLSRFLRKKFKISNFYNEKLTHDHTRGQGQGFKI